MVRTNNKNTLTKIVRSTYNFENVSAIFIAFFSPNNLDTVFLKEFSTVSAT